MNIQWYPGHMAKTRRMIEENLKAVDLVVEIVDARAPLATRNPDFDRIFAKKPRIVLLNKSDLADARITEQWAAWFSAQGVCALAVTCTGGKGVKPVVDLVGRVMAPEVARMAQKGVRKTVRAMVVGIPNVGKSTFINKLRGRAAARASDKPGVTRGKQWIILGPYLEFLDTPGMLWPKFEDAQAAQRLAYLGSVRDDIMDVQELACRFLADMAQTNPDGLKERFKIREMCADGYELLEQACRGRGWILSGGRVDYDRGAKVILDEFRGGKLGRLSLEKPNGGAQL